MALLHEGKKSTPFRSYPWTQAVPLNNLYIKFTEVSLSPDAVEFDLSQDAMPEFAQLALVRTRSESVGNGVCGR